MTAFIDVPLRVDGRGHTGTTGDETHIRQLIYQVLFTSPGERVNRPDFGCGLKQMVFMPNSDALAAATQFLVQGALTRWLGGLIRVERVQVTAIDERLTVTVAYRTRTTGERRGGTFASPGCPRAGG